MSFFSIFSRVPEIQPAELQRMRADKESFTLVDVREDYEWKDARIPGAVLHIPLDQLPASLAKINKEQPVVVYCAHGSRSHSAASFLIKQGYKAVSLSGGLAGWMRNKGEVKHG